MAPTKPRQCECCPREGTRWQTVVGAMGALRLWVCDGHGEEGRG